ncbi:helix-turn-helix domain-containing protein [Streptomyces roseolus]|uniref:helix-turn-helix domain-containing protein n=1 Tax=Streptomyces roseolus TaxID=67358 RepID=UPI003658600D
MIPRGRPVLNEADIARLAGVSLTTWRRQHAAAFREHVPDLLPDSRHLLYDRAQVQAYLDGRPIPELPTGEHPDDLLTAKETATLLGISPSTVQAYATQGDLSPGTTRYGTRLRPRMLRAVARARLLLGVKADLRYTSAVTESEAEQAPSLR